MRADITKLFEHQLDVDPPLEHEKLLEVPAGRGVVMLASEDKPVVMLTAASIRQRLKNRLEHPTEGELKKTADLRKVTTNILWTRTFSEFETDLAFLNISQKIWPANYGRLLACKPANFVQADAGDEYPQLKAVRSNADFSSELIGPFATARQAEGFVNCVNDLFGLCRDWRCLRQYPDSQGCAYRQMKKCVGVCCGDITLDEYRGLFAESYAIVADGLEKYRGDLEWRMKEYSAQLQFESAAATRKQITRLDEYLRSVRDSLEIIRPFEKFRFICVQPGPRFNLARVFAVNFDKIKKLDDLEFPVTQKAAEKIFKKMEKFADEPPCFDKHSINAVGLVSHYLFSSAVKRGLFLRWDENPATGHFAERVTESAAVLKLREPKIRKKKDSQSVDAPVKKDQSE